MTALALVRDAQVTLGDAIDAYLLSLAPVSPLTTRKQYGSILRRLSAALGDRDVADITAADLAAWLTAGFADRAPATWNLSRVAVRSAWAYFTACGWTDGTAVAALAKRKVPEDRNRAIPRHVVDALLADQRIPLRERTLWRLMVESAAREAEVLRLNAEDLDMTHNRATVTRKAGAIDTIIWQSGTAMLLPRLLKGRRKGPLFLTTAKAGTGTPLADVAPDGRGRMSARQAQALFRQHTENQPGGPYVLHGLRHRAATDAVEQGASLPMVKALGGWENMASVARYARPGVEALGQFQAQRDPGRRR